MNLEYCDRCEARLDDEDIFANRDTLDSLLKFLSIKHICLECAIDFIHLKDIFLGIRIPRSEHDKAIDYYTKYVRRNFERSDNESS